jgi:excisionase family DNA binding protein
MNSQTQMMPRGLLTASEFQERYRVSRSYFQRIAHNGELRIHRLGKKILITIEDADAWFARRAVTGATAPFGRAAS